MRMKFLFEWLYLVGAFFFFTARTWSTREGNIYYLEMSVCLPLWPFCYSLKIVSLLLRAVCLLRFPTGGFSCSSFFIFLFFFFLFRHRCAERHLEVIIQVPHMVFVSFMQQLQPLNVC